MTQPKFSITEKACNQVVERQNYGSFEFIRSNRDYMSFGGEDKKYKFCQRSLKLTPALQFASQSLENDSKKATLLSEDSPLIQMSWPPTTIENRSLEWNNYSRRGQLFHKSDEPLTLLENAAKTVPCLGILLSLCASIFLGTAGLLVKMTSSIHGIQVAVFRAIFQLLVYGFIIKLRGSPYLPEAREFMPVMCRAFLGASSITFSYCALKLIPLGDATTIRFSLPIWTLILSFLVLNESCSFYKLFAVVLSITGVYLIAKPDDCVYFFSKIIQGLKFNTTDLEHSGNNQITQVDADQTMNGNTKENNQANNSGETPLRQLEGSLLALASSVCLSISLVALRLCKYTPAEVTILWLSIISIVIGSLSLLVMQEWRLPDNRSDVLYIFLNGICGSIGQWFITSALKIEQSGVISLARTFDIEVAFLYSAFILHENIRITSIVGSVLVSFGVLTVVMPKWLKSRRECSGQVEANNDNNNQDNDNSNLENCRATINRYPQYRTIQATG